MDKQPVVPRPSLIATRMVYQAGDVVVYSGQGH